MLACYRATVSATKSATVSSMTTPSPASQLVRALEAYSENQRLLIEQVRRLGDAHAARAAATGYATDSPVNQVNQVKDSKSSLQEPAGHEDPYRAPFGVVDLSGLRTRRDYDYFVDLDRKLGELRR